MGRHDLYNDGRLSVRHANGSVPGMYAVSPVIGAERFTDLSDQDVAVLAHFQRELRGGLRGLCDVALCGLYVEEHPGESLASITLPFHIDRLTERFDVGVYQPHIEEYIKSYSPADGQLAAEFDARIVRHLEDVGGIVRPVSSAANTASELASKSPEVAIEAIVDIDDESELPTAPEGKKYYVCIGGSKNFQAFLARDGMSKGEFLDVYANELDEALQPIYEDEAVTIRQDAKYAIPGFYIVSPKQHYRSIDEMPEAYFSQCMVAVKRVKETLQDLGIEYSHIYHDEKYRSPASAHFWVLPLPQESGGLDVTIYSRDVWEFLDTYPRFSTTREQIYDYNSHMRAKLNTA